MKKVLKIIGLILVLPFAIAQKINYQVRHSWKYQGSYSRRPRKRSALPSRRESPKPTKREY